MMKIISTLTPVYGYTATLSEAPQSWQLRMTIQTNHREITSERNLTLYDLISVSLLDRILDDHKRLLIAEYQRQFVAQPAEPMISNEE